jgi:hypothetical protein
MTNEVVKPSKLIRGMTSGMRAHLDAVERAREIYLTGMKNRHWNRKHRRLTKPLL